ncbi:MAG: RNA polymerase sigma factor [Bacteroidota bacterium]
MTTANFILEFNHHSDYLRGFAMRLVNDQFSAEDLFQDTAFNAFRHREKFQPNTNMRAWLSRIMKNIFLNQFRKKRRRPHLQDITADNYLLNSAGTINNEGESNMAKEEIVNAINDLDDGLKIPFLLAYQGYQYDEICEKLGGIPLGTVKSRIHYARKILKKKLHQMQPS